MIKLARKVHRKSPDERFAFAHPLCRSGLKGETGNHNAVIPAKAGTQLSRRKHWVPAFAGMTMLFDDAVPRIIVCGSQHP